MRQEKLNQLSSRRHRCQVRRHATVRISQGCAFAAHISRDDRLGRLWKSGIEGSEYYAKIGDATGNRGDVIAPWIPPRAVDEEVIKQQTPEFRVLTSTRPMSAAICSTVDPPDNTSPGSAPAFTRSATASPHPQAAAMIIGLSPCLLRGSGFAPKDKSLRTDSARPWEF